MCAYLTVEGYLLNVFSSTNKELFFLGVVRYFAKVYKRVFSQIGLIGSVY